MLSCMALTEPLLAAVVTTAHKAEDAMPKRTSLPLHISAGSLLAHPLIDAETAKVRVAGLLGPKHNRDDTEENKEHRGEDSQALPFVFHHTPERETQGGRD